jgi:hypothetical protein
MLGRCHIVIAINGKSLPYTPHTILVGPGPTSGGHSSVELDKLRGAFTGSDCHFIIIPKDEFCNVQPRIEGRLFLIY